MKKRRILIQRKSRQACRGACNCGWLLWTRAGLAQINWAGRRPQNSTSETNETSSTSCPSARSEKRHQTQASWSGGDGLDGLERGARDAAKQWIAGTFEGQMRYNQGTNERRRSCMYEIRCHRCDGFKDGECCVLE
jgi:hypothetical protein